MSSQARIEPGDRVVVTGATGFIGSAVARALHGRGAKLVAVVAPGVDDSNLDELDVERVRLDIRDAEAVRAVCSGARFVFHLAAVYRFWARDSRVFYDVNVGGTLNVLEAVRVAGCERLVYTSTVGVLGLGSTKRGRPADETSRADVSRLYGHYKPPRAWTSAWPCPPSRWGRATWRPRRPGRSSSISSTAACPGSSTPR
jgi:dihydroflavonol-4-reductase